jgi:hypothetical protein|tara:strand:+ start:95 stop:580 length:486 start_codon:yes stop_codon:yes gene_type:complete
METNPEPLIEHIHDIHNYILNHSGCNSIEALNMFNIFYGLKKIEDNKLNENIHPEYRYSTLLKQSVIQTDEEFHHLIINGLLKELNYDIPKTIKSDVFRYIITQINDITRIEKETNVSLSGKVYKYFVDGYDNDVYCTERTLVESILFIIIFAGFLSACIS